MLYSRAESFFASLLKHSQRDINLCEGRNKPEYDATKIVSAWIHVVAESFI